MGIILWISGLIGTTGGFLSTMIGGFSYSLQTLVILIGIDYITSLICSLFFKKSKISKKEHYDSKAGIQYLLRKAAIFIAVIVAYQLDFIAETGGGIREAVILFFIAHEGFAIVENLGLMGVPIPAVMKKAFKLLESDEEQEDNCKKKNEK